MGVRIYDLESLNRDGWTCVAMPRIGKYEPHDQWCRAHCAWDEWIYFGFDYWFADPRIAVMFKLKWA